MRPNQKLARVIRGRLVTGVEHADDGAGMTAVVTFDDGSRMTVRLAPDAGPSGEARGRVVGVRQDASALQLDLEDGAALRLATAEATSSVLLRDARGRLEYAD